MSGKRGVLSRSLRACWSLFRIRAAEQLQYRAAALSSASIAIFWGLLEVCVISVFYRYGDIRQLSPNGMALHQAVSYVWIGQAVVMMGMMGVDGEVLRLITSGDVGVELCRPLDLYFHWFAKSCAGRVGALSWRLVLVLLAGLLMPEGWRLQLPASPAGFVLFAVSVVCALLLSTAYGMLATSIRLGITWGDAPINVMMLVGGVLSGSYLPLQLWPDALQNLLLIQPFAGYLDIPARLYVGTMRPAEAPLLLGLQLIWTLVFILSGRAILRRKLSRLIVQGG